jgi:hypothetical protein
LPGYQVTLNETFASRSYVASRSHPMPLTGATFRSYEFDRMVVLFSMMNEQIEVPCAVSTAAMDDLDKSTRTAPDKREAQFLRLREKIEQRAQRKFQDMEFEGTPRGIILRSIDFR